MSHSEGDDYVVPQALRLTFRAEVGPFRQLALRLMLRPQPRDLDHDRAHEAVAGLGDALAAAALAAVVGAVRAS